MGLEDAFLWFPKLYTKRFTLRKLEIDDAPNLFSYFSLEEVTKFYDLEAFKTLQQAVGLLHRIDQCYIEGVQLRWAITSKDTNELIGTCGFHSIEPEHYKAEIGYDLHPKWWGQGIMTEVVNEVIYYGFTELDFNRIEAYYHPENIASQKVLEKNGFKYEGFLRQRFFKKGISFDAAISAVLKEDFII